MKFGVTAGRNLMLRGSGYLVVVVLTHVCEQFHLFPRMARGLEHSTGHYLDLCAAVLCLTSLAAALFVSALTEKQAKEADAE